MLTNPLLIREMHPDDFDQGLALLQSSFHFTAPSEDRALLREFFQREQRFGVFAEQGLQSQLGILPLDYAYNDHAIPAAAISRVSSWPEYRVLEAGEAMGATTGQIVRKILLREARAGLASALTLLTVNYISFTTVAGLVGGGGIGDFAVRYGYYRYQPDVMIFTVMLLILWVQLLQAIGHYCVRRLDKR